MPAGIETVYKGTTYRSRTEARWAVFLDTLGMHYEYEPFDANGYIPDFVVICAKQLLIEVKPDVTIHTMAKHIAKIERGLRGIWDADVMIVGSTPLPYNGRGPTSFYSYQGLNVPGTSEPTAGLMGEFLGSDDGDLPDWEWDCAIWNECGGCGRANWYHQLMTFAGRPCGCYSGDHYLTGAMTFERVMRLWDTTHDLTRWEP